MISDEQTVMSPVNARHGTCSLLYSVYNDHYCFTAIIMMTTETSLALPLRRLSLSVNDPLIQNLAGLLVLGPGRSAIPGESLLLAFLLIPIAVARLAGKYKTLFYAF